MRLGSAPFIGRDPEFILRGNVQTLLETGKRRDAYHLRLFHTVDESSHLLRALQRLGWILFVTV